MFGTLSRTRQRAPCAPRFPTTIVSANSCAATSQMRSAGSPRSTRVRVATPGNRAGIPARYDRRVGRAVGVDHGTQIRFRGDVEHQELGTPVPGQSGRVLDGEIGRGRGIRSHQDGAHLMPPSSRSRTYACRPLRTTRPPPRLRGGASTTPPGRFRHRKRRDGGHPALGLGRSPRPSPVVPMTATVSDVRLRLQSTRGGLHMQLADGRRWERRRLAVAVLTSAMTLAAILAVPRPRAPPDARLRGACGRAAAVRPSTSAPRAVSRWRPAPEPPEPASSSRDVWAPRGSSNLIP